MRYLFAIIFLSCYISGFEPNKSEFFRDKITSDGKVRKILQTVYCKLDLTADVEKDLRSKQFFNDLSLLKQNDLNQGSLLAKSLDLEFLED